MLPARSAAQTKMDGYSRHHSCGSRDGETDSGGSAAESERPPPSSHADPISVEVLDGQRFVRLPAARLAEAVRTVCRLAGVASAEISVAVVDNARIHDLNRRFLGHDHPTDVISFTYATHPVGPAEGMRGSGDEAVADVPARGCAVEGEIIVSGQMAAERAAEFGWRPEDELLLYVVHGMWHVCGLDDRTERERAAMRRLERRALERLQVAWPEASGRAAQTDGEGTR
ncbi:MAG: rRNA maturation RNase YbeY [Planctomycetota bacterium]|nr:MAG: rRNA maturation RNase YbeY [Planctomycetota bacterium]